ncbi:MAG TPA: hypothetical protein VHN36_08435, partial [Ilumatobacteraceae bacterium]|nr:hypothetical protein [Ilumatobacteraceae bacterium]
MALVASFLLFTAGLVVVAPGLMSASAGSGSHSGSGGDGNDPSKCTIDHAGDSGDAVSQDGYDQQDDDSTDTATVADDGSKGDGGHDDGHHHRRHGHGRGPGQGGDCATTATLTLNNVVVNDNGGTATVADFTLTATSSVGGVAVISGPDPAADSPVGITVDLPVTDSYVLGESGPAGYTASAWQCSAGTLDGSTLT